jgi:uncharacterized protein YcaQ
MRHAMPAAELTWDGVAAWRARRHHLHERAPRDRMLALVDQLCGVHAQVMSSAELTLWARIDDLESDAVANALWEDRTLVKTWAMRGTLHLLPASDYALWQAALSTQYVRFTKPSWSKASGLQPDELERLIDAVHDALDGEPLTREELAAAVTRDSGDPALGEALRESWGAMLKPAAVQGALCFAPGEGQKVRFTRPDTWLGDHLGGDPHDPDAAAAEAARRCLAVHGPGTREDVARWWGVQPAPAGRLLKQLGDEVAEVLVEGEPYLALTADVDDLAGAEPVNSVRLLPGFDQYVIAATRHAERLMPDGDVRPLVYRQQGWISAVLFVDGRIDGVWRYERKGKRLEIEIEPFPGIKPTKHVRAAAEAEAEGVATFMGGALSLSWV